MSIRAGRGAMLDLTIPGDFPAEAYRALHEIVHAAERAPDVLEQFDAAWAGVAIRFAGMARAGDQFCASLRDAGRHPGADELFRQEEALFGLVTNGVAAIESFGYAMFAAGAMVKPAAFPMATPVDRRNATLGSTMRLYSREFPEAAITRAFFWWCNSREFGWWKEVRGLLSQRVAPHRAVDGGPAHSLTRGEWWLRAERVDLGFAAARRAWVAAALDGLLREANVFGESVLAPR